MNPALKAGKTRHAPTVGTEEAEAKNWRRLLVIMVGLLATGSPSSALPNFAQRYGVDCDQCHSIPPRLNRFGLAFQANHCDWPGKKPPATRAGRKPDLPTLPFSGLATLSSEDNRTERKSTAEFHTLELFMARGFNLRHLQAATRR